VNWNEVQSNHPINIHPEMGQECSQSAEGPESPEVVEEPEAPLLSENPSGVMWGCQRKAASGTILPSVDSGRGTIESSELAADA